MQPESVVLGAGKIGRGFIAHLLYCSGHRITLIDVSADLIAQLRARGKYRIEVLGAPDKSTEMSQFTALSTAESAAVAAAVVAAEMVFVSVGGPNLAAAGALLAAGIGQRAASMPARPLNIIICENYKDPAALLRQGIYADLDTGARAWCDLHLGIAETQVLRSCIEPTDEMRRTDPLSVQVQDWWVLPCDGEAIRGDPPRVEGLAYKANFRHELIRKVYTYNCSNATIAYLGWLRGAEMLHEAANDEEILALTQAVYDESGEALIAEYGFDPTEQKKLQTMAVTKYRDRKIKDTIERNARDSRRKLSPTDRLLGPANLVLKHGGQPRALALAIAAAAHYAGSDDPGTQAVQALLHSQGLRAVLREICELPDDGALSALVLAVAGDLSRFNQRGVEIVVR